MGHEYLPITSSSLLDLMATLAAAHYRSAPSYISVWKKDHILGDHVWTDKLQAESRDWDTAATRGIGAPRRAEAYKAEELPRVPAVPEAEPRRGPLWPGHAVSAGTCWLLRGLELADLLREQATTDTSRRTATLGLAATKRTPEGEVASGSSRAFARRSSWALAPIASCRRYCGFTGSAASETSTPSSRTAGERRRRPSR